jgi:enoyl-CoA hydratase/carnithine racemase
MQNVDLGTPFLRFEVEGHLAWCTIDRPQARNALTAAMYYGIKRAVAWVNRADTPTALILTGVGDVFAPGGELRGKQEDENPALAEIAASDVVPFEAIRNSRTPVVAAVNGIAYGGGLLIAMLADVAVASERAVFRAPELLLGIADTGYAAYLPPHVGLARARDLLLTGRRVGAAEAREIGLISRVVPHERLREEARLVAEDILRTGPEARLHVKRILNSGYGSVDRMTFEASLRGAEAREGMRAFAEKRSPDWIPPAIDTGKRI